MFGLRKVQHRPMAAEGASTHDKGTLREDVPRTEVGGEADAFAQSLPEETEGDPRAIDDILEIGVGIIANENGLTRREREVLAYLARGRSARYIAEDLVISENTVWAHVKRIYAKTDVHTKQELMSAVEQAALKRL